MRLSLPAVVTFISIFAFGESTGLRKRCGSAQEFTTYAPQPAFWNNINTDFWLDAWWTNNSNTFSQLGGFSGALSSRFLGNSDLLSCYQQDTCVLDTCDKPLNDAGPEMQPAYYTMLSMQNLANQYMNMLNAIPTAGGFAALKKDSWSSTYYHTEPPINLTPWVELMYTIADLIGLASLVAAPVAGLLGAAEATTQAVGTAAGVATSLLSSGMWAGVVYYDDQVAPSLSVPQAPDIGTEIANFLYGAFNQTIELQNTLLSGGKDPQGNDIRSYFQGGAYLSIPDQDTINNAVNYYIIMSQAIGINILWRAQAVFIMGGGNCNDSDGIGSGPQQGKVCRNGVAWYIYQWFDNGGGITGSPDGYVYSPQGSTTLGSALGITIEDIINSSLDAYITAKLNYASGIRQARMIDAVTNGWANPTKLGPAWEGIFTIPVCNVSWAVNQNLDAQQFILQPWGGESRPQWCGPVCEGDMLLTQQFLTTTNLYGGEAKQFDPSAACGNVTIPYSSTQPPAPTATPTGLLPGQNA